MRLKPTEARIPTRWLCKHQLVTKTCNLERRYLKHLGSKKWEQKSNFWTAGVQRSETRPHRTRKLGPGECIWRRQMKDEGMWKKQRTGAGAEKGRKACHVSYERPAENLYLLKYSPKTSAAHYFHCSKHQWKALPKPSTSSQCWLIGTTAAGCSSSYCISPCGRSAQPITTGPLWVTLVAGYRSSGGFDCVSKSQVIPDTRSNINRPHYWHDISTPKSCHFRIDGARETWVCSIIALNYSPSPPTHPKGPQPLHSTLRACCG